MGSPQIATLDKIVKVARGELGQHPYEVPAGSNRTKYGKAFELDGYAWCAMWLYWLYHLKGNVPIAKGVPWPKTAYTPTLAQAFINVKRFGKVPILGACPHYNFRDSLDRIQHTGGPVIRIGNGWFECIEGNTSSGDSGSQDDGGGVYVRRRALDSQVVGFGYPLLAKAEELPRFIVPKEKAWFGKGDSGADVKNWQRDLNQWMAAVRELRGKRLTFDFGRIEVTGEFTDETRKATLTFQQDRGLDVDGRVGKDTIERMEKARNWQERRIADRKDGSDHVPKRS